MVKNVKILGLNHQVVYPKSGDFLDGNMGRYNAMSNIITVNPDMPEENVLMTLIHESLHGIAYNLGMDELMTEENTDRMTTGVFNLIKDNPKLVAKIVELNDKRK